VVLPETIVDVLSPLNDTTLLPGVGSKLLPLIVTVEPGGPLLGAKLLITGGGRMVKLVLLLATCPPTFIVIGPVLAPLGTATLSCVDVAPEKTDADSPLIVTLSFAAIVLKLVPLIWTASPAEPEVGLKLVIVGAGTVKLDPLVPVSPPTVTESVPVVAPLGTVATSFVVVALVIVAVTPLNFTVSLAAVALKLLPLIVTDVPTTPLVGLKLVIDGATVTV